MWIENLKKISLLRKKCVYIIYAFLKCYKVSILKCYDINSYLLLIMSTKWKLIVFHV